MERDHVVDIKVKDGVGLPRTESGAPCRIGLGIRPSSARQGRLKFGFIIAGSTPGGEEGAAVLSEFRVEMN